MRLLCIISLFIYLNSSFSQTITGNMELYLNNYLSSLNNIPQNEYSQPTTNQLNKWNQLIVNILDNNFLIADSLANQLNYSIISYYDTVTNTTYQLLEEKTPQLHFWGITVFNPNSCRSDLIIQAPHPIKDFNTGKQAIFTYFKTKALVLMISGTNRCNHNTPTSCDGSTSVCNGSPLPYPISDVAHNDESVFQKTTSTLHNKIPSSLFIQFHGFTKTSSDPYLIASNGNNKTPVIDYISSLTNELSMIDPSISYKVPHIDTSWNRLIGSTNVQGRLINGSADPCNTSSNLNSGRFIHLEQEKNKLRLNANGWIKMSEAIENIVPCETNSLTINLSNNSPKVYPNPFNNIIRINYEYKIESIELYNTQGKLVYIFKATNSIDLSTLNKGTYYLKIHSEKEVYTKRIIKN